MTENSKIEWTDHTCNHVRGCTKVAPGCQHCYADDLSKRNPGTLGIWGPNGTRVVAAEKYWQEPLKWNRTAIATCVECGNTCTTELAPKGVSPVTHVWDFECSCGCNSSVVRKPRVFCESLGDVFEDWDGPMHNHLGQQLFTINGTEWFTEGEYPDCRPLAMQDVRRRLISLSDATPNIDWLFLTKRPENVPAMWPGTPGVHPHNPIDNYESALASNWRPNVWLGTSISDQATADRNIPLLLKCRDMAPVLFVSAEPLLGPVVLPDEFLQRGKQAWLIAGGESGHHARPMHPDWARSLRDQCQTAGVPFLFKQWGEWAEVPFDSDNPAVRNNWERRHTGILQRWLNIAGGHGFHGERVVRINRVGKKVAGRTLDGRTWDEFPNTASVNTTDAGKGVVDE